ncbi:MAG: PEP-CTERM sorting domain-containing protein [Verrucomicrobiales bacterium]|jgi:hypothetical protein|nr:PEP-CTERM sorting domain-containing protein [Verrucomicrobiales bacterium]
MKKNNLKYYLFAVGCYALTVSAHAQWTGVAGDNSYWNPDNWVAGIVNNQFIGPVNGGYGWVSATNYSPGNNAVFTTDSFIYYNTDEVNFGLQVVNVGGLTLNGPGNTFTFSVDLGTTTAQRVFTLGGHAGWGNMLNANGKNLVFDVSPSLANSYLGWENAGPDHFNLYVTATNIGSLTKTGGGALIVSGIDSLKLHVSGSVSVQDGLLWLATGNNVISEPRIVGATQYDISNRAILLLDSYTNATAQTPVNLIEAVPVHLRDGALLARIMASGAVGPFNQSVGAVRLRSGESVIGLTGNSQSTTNPSVLTMASLTRENYATVSVVGNYNGYSTFIRVTNDQNILDALVGGVIADTVLNGTDEKTGTGITNLKILPWALGRGNGENRGAYFNYNSGWAAGNDPYLDNTMVTYSATGGLRWLRDNEYYRTDTDKTLLGAADDDNVWLGTAAAANQLTQSKTINALRVTNWDAGITFQSSATLTLTSGLIVTSNAGGRINIGSAGDAGYLNSGDRELIIAGGAGGITFNVPIINDLDADKDSHRAGVILATSNTSSGFATFNAANYYGGATIVQGGLNINNIAALPQTTDLRIDRFGIVNINFNNNLAALRVNKLTGSGQINFASASVTGRFIIGTSGTVADYAERSISVNSGFIIAPGDDGDVPTGTLLIGNNVTAVNFLAGSFFDVDLGADSLSDSLAALGDSTALTFASGANLRLKLLAAPADDATWVLASNFSNLTGDLDLVNILDSGNNPLDDYALSFDNGHLLLNYIAIPEPSVLLLLGIGAGLLTLLRRRK